MTDNNDKAAVEALLRVRCQPSSKAYSHGDLAVPYVEGARAILDAIRKGTVPGVIFDHGAVAAMMRAVARLENGIAEMERADRAAAERDRLAGLLRKAIHAIDTRFNNSLVGDIEAALAEIGGGE